jgi:hypothetical protein
MELGFAVRNKFYDDWMAKALKDYDYAGNETGLSDWMTLRTNMRIAQAQLNALRVRNNIPISPTSSTSSKDSNMTTSSNPEGRNKLIGYIMEYLNRTTADAPAMPSLIAPVETGKAKKVGYDAWNVMLDDSVIPRQKILRNPLQIDKQAAQTEYRVVGAELVSSVLNFDNEQDWLPKLQQLEKNLTFNETSDRGAWFYDLTHLHVHFAVKDKELSLPVATTVCALYGLFENDIQSWLPVTQRESPFRKRLRLGMGKERLEYDADGTDVLLLPGKRFTPREFTDRLYGATNLQELKTEVSGWSAGEWVHPQSTRMSPSYDIKMNAYPVFAREWVVVNVSLGRENKPHTLEFRHHHGTMDPEAIRWW